MGKQESAATAPDNFHGARVYLGERATLEMDELPPQRQSAIQPLSLPALASAEFQGMPTCC